MKHIIANWKMNLGVRASVAMARSVLRDMRGKEYNPHLILCPSHTALSEVRKVLAHTKVHMGSQSVAADRSGAYSGQISTAQLEDIGATHALIGHLEHTDTPTFESVLDKLEHVLETGVQPITYLGTTIKEESDLRLIAVKDQLSEIISRYRKAAPKQQQRQKLMLVIEPAYVSLSSTPADPVLVAQLFSDVKSYLMEEGITKDEVVLCYGGHVDSENAYGFLREPDIDGLAIGAASIKINQFTHIMEQAREFIAVQ